MSESDGRLTTIILNQMNTNKKEIRMDIAVLRIEIKEVRKENATQTRRLDEHERKIDSNDKAIGRTFNENKATRKWGVGITCFLFVGVITTLGYVGGAGAVINWLKGFLK